MPTRNPPPVESVTLSTLRNARGWKEQDLAETTGLSVKRISDYERNRAPSRERLEELAAAMDYGSDAIDFVQLGITQALTPAAEPLSPVDPSPEELRRLHQAAAQVSAATLEMMKGHLLKVVRTRRAWKARRRAEQSWSRFQTFTPERQRLIIQRSQEFQTWSFAERLCHESTEAASNSAQEARELAELALLAASVSPGSEAWRRCLEAYCLAFLANAYRVQGDHQAAEQAFACAWKLWELGTEAGSGPPLAEWRLHDLEASLRKDQRRFPEALEALARAEALAPREAAGRILLKKGSTLEQMGEGERALEALQQAAPLVDGRLQPRQIFLLQFSTAGSLCDLDRYAEAEALLPEVRELAVALRRQLDLVRLLWLQGKVDAGLGRPADAEAAFQQVREEFANRNMAYDCALASLDLAVLLLEQGRAAEVSTLAQKLAWIFNAQRVHREALAALRLFCESAEKETATAELARRVARYLKRAQHDPELRFEG